MENCDIAEKALRIYDQMVEADERIEWDFERNLLMSVGALTMKKEEAIEFLQDFISHKDSADVV